MLLHSCCVRECDFIELEMEHDGSTVMYLDKLGCGYIISDSECLSGYRLSQWNSNPTAGTGPFSRCVALI